MAHPEPVFIVTDITVPDELCFIIYWDKNAHRTAGGSWVYEHPLDRERASITNAPPWEWVKFGWKLEMNFSEISTYPCGGCDAPVHYDYLCPKCRT